MNGEIYHNLIEMMGKVNPYNGIKLHQNSTYNDLVFCYYAFYHRLGDVQLEPNELPPIEAITRTIRDLPLREKNMREEQRYHEFYQKAF